MNYHNLTLSVENHIAIITIDNPQTLNSLSPGTLQELERLISDVVADNAIKVGVITGAGEKAFVAGGDIAAMQPLGPLEARKIVQQAQRVFNRIEFGGKVFIAAINGYALGAGCELALACDMRIASEHAKLGQPEVRLGIIPGWGGTQRLPRLIGKGKAKELMLTGDMVTADEALKLGLVNHVVPRERLLESALELATKITTKSQLAVRLIKEAVDNGMDMSIENAFKYEAELFSLCFASHDQKEGMGAFLEKRQPCWKDK